MRLPKLFGGRRGASAPPTPEAVKRTMLGQALIDALLQVSGPVARPAASRLERMWLDALARPELSRLAERLADAPLPRPVLRRLIESWIAAYHVDVEAMAEPIAAYPTLNAFFTRALKPGLRPIERDPDVVASPADANLKAFGPIDARGRIAEVKGRTYAVSDLLEGAMDPAPFTGGQQAVLYLSPRDYHRVHSPFDGRLARAVALAGASYPVNARGVRAVPGLFVKNRRVVFALETVGFGEVAVVMVGATNVGRIGISAPDGPIARGDELGVFNLGSTVVMLFPKAVPVALHQVHEGEMVRVGQGIIRRGP
ncbi:MAG: archaetidylserine decarboxylase [Myxococcota bacterium]